MNFSQDILINSIIVKIKKILIKLNKITNMLVLTKFKSNKCKINLINNKVKILIRVLAVFKRHMEILKLRDLLSGFIKI